MSKKFILIITHSTDNHDRANAAIALAASLISEGADLALFFIFEGALMARKGVAETIEGRHFTPVRDLFPMILEAKIPMYVCGACVKTYEIPADEIMDGVMITHIPTLAGEMMQRETITF
ncbi:MAG: DsrE family protein [bacterium]